MKIKYVKIAIPTGVNVHEFIEKYVEDAYSEGKGMKNTNFLFLTADGIAIFHTGGDNPTLHYGKYTVKKREDFSDEKRAKMEKTAVNGLPTSDKNIH